MQAWFVARVRCDLKLNWPLHSREQENEIKSLALYLVAAKRSSAASDHAATTCDHAAAAWTWHHVPPRTRASRMDSSTAESPVSPPRRRSRSPWPDDLRLLRCPRRFTAHTLEAQPRRKLSHRASKLTCTLRWSSRGNHHGWRSNFSKIASRSICQTPMLSKVL